MSERQFAVSGDWALGVDSLQWILYRRRSRAKGGWDAVSFVGSTREVLARCMGRRAVQTVIERVCSIYCPRPSTSGAKRANHHCRPFPPTRRRRDDRVSGLSG